MSDKWSSSASRHQTLRPFLVNGGEASGRSARFRPLFPGPGSPPEGDPGSPEESQGEQMSQAEVQRMADQWRAKLAEVDRVLQQARQRADALEKEAEERGYRAGYDRGYAAGHAEGMEAARRALDDEVRKVRAVAQAIAQARQELLTSLEPEIVSLALAIAKKVIGEEAQHNENVIAHMVQKAVRQLGQRGPYRIRLNPLDAQRLMDRWKAQDELDGAEWELIPDERISVGGCVLECGAASVDARLEVQLDLIQHALLEGQDAPSAQELPDATLD
ncbi:MAG TPA: hypothetical protein G4O02_15885 [Caldilineae bacterium]|nr:hypothetical protein [Caldilineae bacterium]